MDFTLPYRSPYDWDALLGFLAARATPGVERVDPSGYRRTIAIDGVSGMIAIRRNEQASALTVQVTFPDRHAEPAIAERVARMFDVAADPAAIDAHLSRDPLLARASVAHAGLRVPGAWDPFELTVRAILGQQISVRAATTIAGRVAERWGTAIDSADGLTRLFPTAAQLQDAPIETAGVIGSRARAIRALAGAVAGGTMRLDSPAGLDAMRSIPGIGEWTAQYVALRALKQPDAFLHGDLVLRRMAGNCSPRDLATRAEHWRPWRGYAVMLLWQAATDGAARQDCRTAN